MLLTRYGDRWYMFGLGCSWSCGLYQKSWESQDYLYNDIVIKMGVFWGLGYVRISLVATPLHKKGTKMTPNQKAALDLMLKNALLNQAEDKNNGRFLTDNDRAYLDGVINTLKTIKTLFTKEGAN